MLPPGFVGGFISTGEPQTEDEVDLPVVTEAMEEEAMQAAMNGSLDVVRDKEGVYANDYKMSSLPVESWLQIKDLPTFGTKTAVPGAEVGGFGSHHFGGANFVFADGSVRFLSMNVDRTLFQKMANRADGDLIPGVD
jgi:prepilin-type processing-associated H-X9-DG protein